MDVNYSDEVIQRANFNQKLDQAINNVRGDRDFYLVQAQAEVDGQNRFIQDQLNSFKPDYK